MAAAPDGSVYVFDTRPGSAYLRKLTPLGVKTAPGLALDESLIHDAGGATAHIFKAGKHDRTIDTRSGRTLLSFVYGVDGLLTEVREHVGVGASELRTTTINRTGSKVTLTSSGGYATTVWLDQNGWVSKLENPASEETLASLDSSGLMTGWTTPRGHLHTFGYDGVGKLKTDQQPAPFSGLTVLESQKMVLPTVPKTTGWEVARSSPEGRVTRHQVTRLPAPVTAGGEAVDAESTTTTYPDQSSVTRTVYASGDVRTTTSTGVTTRVKLAPDPRLGMSAPVPAEVTTTMGEAPNALTVTSTTAVTCAGCTQTQVGTLVVTSKVDGDSWRSTYESTPTRRVMLESPALTGSGTRLAATMTLDDMGRVTTIARPGQGDVSLTYDPVVGTVYSVAQGGRVATFEQGPDHTLSRVTDPLGRTVRLGRDLAARPTTVELPKVNDAQGAKATPFISLDHDKSGNLTSLTLPQQQASSTPHLFSFDALDRPSTYTPAAAAQHATMTFDRDHLLTSITRLDGQVLSMVREPATGKLDMVKHGSALLLDMGYDSKRRLSSIERQNGEKVSVTNFVGNLPQRVHIDSPELGQHDIELSYDGKLQVSTVALDGEGLTINRYPDGVLRSTSLTSPLAATLSVTRDATTGWVTGTSVGSASKVDETFTYDATYGELDTHTVKRGATQLYQLDIEQRDNLGRIVQQLETVDATTVRRHFTYDEHGRLIGTRDCTNPTCTAGPERTATYDLDGNRVAYSPLAGSASYDDQDRLITLGTTTYQHSPDGERTKKNAITYTHNAEGQLEKVVNGATTIDYVLDPFGRRVARKKNGTVTHRFLWGSALGPIAEVDASGNVVTRYVYGTRANVPDFMVKGSQVLRLVTDLRGSVRLVVDVATGAVMQHIEYDEWGKQTLNSSPGLQPFGFAGGLSDDETGLVRFGARDYDPEVGRWVTKDPIGFDGGMNVYVYAANDPVNLVDPEGRAAAVAVDAVVVSGVIGAATGGGASALHQYALTGTVDWGDVAIAAASGGVAGALAPHLAVAQAGRLGAAGVGTALSIAQYLIGEKFYHDRPITMRGLSCAAFVGALGGFISGTFGPNEYVNKTRYNTVGEVNNLNFEAVKASTTGSGLTQGVTGAFVGGIPAPTADDPPFTPFPYGSKALLY